MNQTFWKICSAILGGLFLVSIVFLVLFGVKISSNNKDKTAELTKALTAQEKELRKTFQTEKEKTTTKYTAGEIFGAFEFSFPKVWDTNIHEAEGKTEELTFLADQNPVVIKDGSKESVGLRVVVYKDKYATQLKNTEDKTKNNTKTKLTEEDVTVSDVKGKKFTGTTEASGDKKVQFILLPLRDKTLYIGTDNIDVYADQYKKIVDSLKVSK